MNFSQTYDKVVVDTNVIFMALYNPFGKAARIINLAAEERIYLFSPDSVKKELFNVIKREFNISEELIKENIAKLPVIWMSENFYKEFLDKTKVKHKPDKPIEAVALALNCGILSADHHFKNRINIDELFKQLNKQ